ncbi:hypothetical protein C0Q70_04583 [Pomacea canaliculata]|uniref:Uncharacterized protein n=1 Tax=Pomacea canaliculata TaxID=400727 RepID=A0A2T7PIT9_POMCA|nr:uncharacterized protein LOC112560511 [Pomacea canaliculata]XP_025088201.1 uncharacterized protein LOC112560511 [Pomacea canaliculata]XP_025088202.1 uncharacterized protein LOC112560511 [Pomacea canaliculata]PVD33329.1 hypothetical protein C0Q70_04583 [Pomacea canaliculata]
MNIRDDRLHEENSESDNISSTVRDFLHSEEETLEELVGGFIYLSMDDLHSSDYSLINSQMLQNNAHVSTVSEKGCKSLGTHLLSSEVVSITLSNNKTKGGDGGVDDEVEEETIGDLNCSPAVEVLLQGRPPSLTKFDNFMQNNNPLSETDAEDEFLETPGYVASFGLENTGLAVKRKEKPFLNILSDQNSSTARDLFYKPCAMPSASFNSDSEGSVEYATDYVIAPSCKLSHTTLFSSNPDCATASIYQHPGEADDGITAPVVVPTVSVLGTSTLVTPTPVSADSGTLLEAERETEDHGDVVVPFKLDPCFDYDSVPYTPKFSKAEMDYLTSFLPRN